jgi:hypothetical protein
MRRVHGSVPPKPDNVILTKAKNSSEWVGTDGFGLGEFGLGEFGLGEFGLGEFGLGEFGLGEAARSGMRRD